MYTILIADDELITLEMLKDFIEWDNLRIKKVYTAEDGLEALGKAIKYKPDIIISDIKMPRLNGIDFISKVTNKLPNTQFIFLSGYTDKEYLMAAIKLRTINYIEKPIDIDEIIVSIRNAVKECDKIVTNNIKNISFIKRDLCNKMIHNKIDNTSIDKLLSTIGINSSINHMVSCIFIIIYNETTINDLLENFDYNDIIYCNLEKKNIILFYFNSYNNFNNIKNIFKDRLSSKVNYLASISDNVPINNYQDTYLQAKQLHKLCFLKGLNRIVSSSDKLDSNNSFSLPNITNIIKQYILNNKIEKTRDTFKDICNSCKKHQFCNIHEIKKYFIDITIVLKQMSYERQYTDIHDNCNNAIQQISNAYTLDSIYFIVIELVEQLTKRIHQFTNTEYIVKKIINIIELEYNTQNLSINNISDALKLTPSYICMIFKKNTGKTINTYITDIRINIAKQFLLNTEHKIYHIANMVGYKDGKYFSKVFEKSVGIKPRKYREINTYEK